MVLVRGLERFAGQSSPKRQFPIHRNVRICNCVALAPPWAGGTLTNIDVSSGVHVNE